MKIARRRTSRSVPESVGRAGAQKPQGAHKGDNQIRLKLPKAPDFIRPRAPPAAPGQPPIELAPPPPDIIFFGARGLSPRDYRGRPHRAAGNPE